MVSIQFRELFSIPRGDALEQVIAKCINGAKIIDICLEGDNIITKQTGEQQKENINNGIAFPTSVSVNNCVAYFSPLADDPEAGKILNEGDVVKM